MEEDWGAFAPPDVRRVILNSFCWSDWTRLVWAQMTERRRFSPSVCFCTRRDSLKGKSRVWEIILDIRYLSYLYLHDNKFQLCNLIGWATFKTIIITSNVTLTRIINTTLLFLLHTNYFPNAVLVWPMYIQKYGIRKLFLNKIHTFTQQGCIELIRSANKCTSSELSIHLWILKNKMCHGFHKNIGQHEYFKHC